jgi:ankyrin repeat protein
MILLSKRNQSSLILRFLNHSQFQPNHQDIHGNTPLLCAFERKDSNAIGIDQNELFETINLLLEKGADPELANNAGFTPLDAAQKTNIKSLIELIEKAIENKRLVSKK